MGRSLSAFSNPRQDLSPSRGTYTGDYWRPLSTAMVPEPLLRLRIAMKDVPWIRSPRGDF